ncbi:MAG: sigma-70 family RNA polymerase sigma factor [Bacteroidetes bacterium]|nr:sigma-70 family RNA polymerase sigma factor [Fibrella sp.]
MVTFLGNLSRSSPAISRNGGLFVTGSLVAYSKANVVAKEDMPTQDDYLDKAIRGERTGLEYLVDAYQTMAYTIAIRIVGNREDAEEVVQDSFLKAFTYLESFKRAAKFSTWLYRIVYNTALAKIGAKQLPTTVLSEDTEQRAYVQEDDNVWHNLIKADRKKYVALALDQLKEDDRLIITLHYMAEKSVGEITEILDMKSSAVKMRLLRGRKQLEGLLRQLLNDELTDL